MSLPTYICECRFEVPDSDHPGYSSTEYDLYPAVGPSGENYSIRRNFSSMPDVYEIFDYMSDGRWSEESVWFSSSCLEEVVGRAAELEEAATGGSSLEYGHCVESVQCSFGFDEWRQGHEDVYMVKDVDRE